MQKTKEMNHFFLIDKPRNKQYRFSYDKEFTVKEKLKWRERWLKGELLFECGCGKSFAINKGGSIYYPAQGDEIKPHAPYCSRRKSASSQTTATESKKKKWIVLTVPEIPTHNKAPLGAGVEEKRLAERMVEPYPMTQMGSLKPKTGRKWAQSKGKEVHINSLLVETASELKQKKAMEDVVLVIRPIVSIEAGRYGVVKVNLLDADEKTMSVWVKHEVLLAMQAESGIVPEEMEREANLSERFWFSAVGYVREEKWNNRTFRKVYIMRGALLQVKWN